MMEQQILTILQFHFTLFYTSFQVISPNIMTRVVLHCLVGISAKMLLHLHVFLAKIKFACANLSSTAHSHMYMCVKSYVCVHEGCVLLPLA